MHHPTTTEINVKRFIISTLVAGIAMTAPAASASAQGSNPFEIGGAFGASVPVGDIADGLDMGFNATFILGYKPSFSPLGFRAEAGYNQFGITGFSESVNIAAFTGNALFEVPTGGFTPYLIGGAGLYRLGNSVDSNSSNEFGFNVGGGISMPLSGFKVFVEARYNRVSDDTGSFGFVPIVFGAIF